MLHNINTIQNLEDINHQTSNNSYSNEYLIQALANAGQRLGIKGDSISIGSFTFKDLIKDTSEINSINSKDYGNYNGFIVYNENKFLTGLIKKGKKYETNIVQDENCRYYYNENIFNKSVLTNKFGFDNIINNIEYYTSNNIIEYDNKYFYNLMYGKVIGVDDNELNNVEIIYNKYNDSTNQLELAIRVFHLYNNGISNIYCMLVLKQDNHSKYNLELYQFDTSLLEGSKFGEDSVRSTFESSFNYNSNNDNNIFLKFDNYKNEDALFHYKSVTDCTLFGLIKYHELNSRLNPVKSVNVEYNSQSNVLFSLENDEQNSLDLILEKKNENVKTRLYYFSNDIIYNLPNYLKLYSEKNFIANTKTLYTRILFEIYEYLYEKYNESDNLYVLYFPLDYAFNYIYNENNELQIYHSEDILLNTLNIETKKDVKNEYLLLSNLDKVIFDAPNITNEIFENIKFNIDYNNINTSYPSNISIYNIYTLPYINENNLWVLNGIETTIKATGKNAGNPNIIILNNDYIDGEFKTQISSANVNILNSVQNTSLFGYEKLVFNINPNLFINEFKSNITNFSANAFLPLITESNIDLFENSLIFLISSKHTLNIDLDDENIKNSLSIPDYFSSLWYVNNEIRKFDYVRENNADYALDLSQLLNTNYIIEQYSKIYSQQSEPLFNNLKLRKKKLGEQNNYTDTSYSILNVEDPSNYDKRLKYEKDVEEITYYTNNNKYKNGLNLSIKFNNQPGDKFLDNISHLDVTNVPYLNLEYDVNTDDKSVDFYEYVIQNNLFTESFYNAIYDESNNVDVIDVKYQSSYTYITTKNKIENINEYISSPSEYSLSAVKIDGYKNEYVFNKDVPSLDLQEVLMVNSNTLNRLNVISVSYTGKLYNAYLGSSFENGTDKSEFIIGTTSYNINIGDQTLVDLSNVGNTFLPQSKLKLNFPNIELNGVTTVNSYLTCNDVIYSNKLVNDLNIKKYNVIDSKKEYFTTYEFNYDKYSYLGILSCFDVSKIYEQTQVEIGDSIIYDSNSEPGSFNTLLTYNDTLGIYKLCNNISNNTDENGEVISTNYDFAYNFLGVHIRKDNNNKDIIYNPNYLNNGKPIHNIYLYQYNIIDGILNSSDISITTRNQFNQGFCQNERNFTTFIYLNNMVDEYLKTIYGKDLSELNDKLEIRYYISSTKYDDILDKTNKISTITHTVTGDIETTGSINNGIYNNDLNNYFTNNIDNILKLKVDNRYDYFIELPYSDEMYENLILSQKIDPTTWDKLKDNYVKLSNNIKFITYENSGKYILEIYYKGNKNNLTINFGYYNNGTLYPKAGYLNNTFGTNDKPAQNKIINYGLMTYQYTNNN